MENHLIIVEEGNLIILTIVPTGEEQLVVLVEVDRQLLQYHNQYHRHHGRGVRRGAHHRHYTLE